MIEQLFDGVELALVEFVDVVLMNVVMVVALGRDVFVVVNQDVVHWLSFFVDVDVYREFGELMVPVFDEVDEEPKDGGGVVDFFDEVVVVEDG